MDHARDCNKIALVKRIDMPQKFGQFRSRVADISVLHARDGCNHAIVSKFAQQSARRLGRDVDSPSDILDRPHAWSRVPQQQQRLKLRNGVYSLMDELEGFLIVLWNIRHLAKASISHNDVVLPAALKSM